LVKLIKILHISLVLISFASFISRVALLQFNPKVLQIKWLKILPHVIDTLLLLSGIYLVIQGSWLAGEYGWLVAKIVALIAYIGLGITVMHQQGKTRWLAFTGAIACYAYILSVAISKNIIPW
jgi:uncharacterized membrane protein SirB2